MLHQDEAYFPNPLKFDPERWVKDVRRLEKAFGPFGKGTRACVGMPYEFHSSLSCFLGFANNLLDKTRILRDLGNARDPL
jgi:hypothetical protein